MALNGIDISSWQSGIDLSHVPCDFVIVKATGGVKYVNPDCDRAYQQAKSLGKLRGFYHYAREKGCKGSPSEEARFFIDSTRNYFGEAIPILDWEEELGLGVAWAKEWLDFVYNETGVRPMIYTSKSVLREYDWTPVFAGNYGLWYAQYANMNPTGYQSDPWTDTNGLGAWPFAAMFQYSSVGRLPGYPGNLDLNIFYGDAGTWAAYAGGSTVVKPPQPSTPSADVWYTPGVDLVAHEVCEGLWGNGNDHRRDAIYAAVRKRVDELMS